VYFTGIGPPSWKAVLESDSPIRPSRVVASDKATAAPYRILTGQRMEQ
jgi:hypothetical protein